MLKTLEYMCRDLLFDEESATKCICQIDINQELISSRFEGTPYISTLLNEAVMSTNIRMVKLLLDNGANPNLLFDDGSECVLWDLQYQGEDSAQNDQTRLQMVQLLLEYGADPCITTRDGWEDLFTWVSSALFNDDIDDLWKYRARFFILLVAYGGKSDYCTPRVIGKFDMAKMQQYRFILVPERNNKYSGLIVDGQGNKIAYI